MQKERIYHIAVFEQVDETLNQIISIDSSSMRDLLGLTHNSIGVSILTAQLVADAYSKGLNVYYMRSCQSIELLPSDLIIGDDNLSIQVIRNRYLVDARYHISHKQAIVTGIMMFDFICINNILIDKGFVITEDNREEKYIEILETEDEVLIEKLERYLNARDNIERASFMEHEYQKFYSDIKQADNIEEVKEIGSKFLQRIQDVSK